MSISIKSQVEAVIQDKISDFPYKSGKISTRQGKTYYLKSGKASTYYACEAHGLNELREANAIDVALPVAYSENFILTAFVAPSDNISDDFFADFGRKLALLHQVTASEFGFYEDNFIGNNPQQNISNKTEKNDWAAFFFNNRLLLQFKMAEKKGYITPQLRQTFSFIEKQIQLLIGNVREAPSLVHGDLWSGNFLCNQLLNPVLIDPAVYYGHRETDIAMTRLFGGFPTSFYQAYNDTYPLVEGWEKRFGLYNLYHLFNHLNLFGRSYLSEIEITMKYLINMTNQYR